MRSVDRLIDRGFAPVAKVLSFIVDNEACSRAAVLKLSINDGWLNAGWQARCIWKIRDLKHLAGSACGRISRVDELLAHDGVVADLATWSSVAVRTPTVAPTSGSSPSFR